MITIAFDVDGTLMTEDGKINENIRQLIVLLSQMPQTCIVVWSGSGESRAAMSVREAGISQYVNRICAKNDLVSPDITFDDMDCKTGKVNIRI
jgi:hydroxymethylpyrimidine pyrophosphatase-like HAD family hydrolase